MKKTITIITAFLLMSFCGKVSAQNLQLLYDFGSEIYNDDLSSRSPYTTTFEMLKPDAYGTSFMFFDLFYGPEKGINSLYLEAFRDLCFWKGTKMENFALHLEYNGGISIQQGGYNNSWLAGVTYSLHSRDYSKTFSLTASYQYNPKSLAMNYIDKDEHGYHLTGVWDVNFAQGWCEFTGFAEEWRQAKCYYGTTHCFMAKPQLWVNLNKIEGWDDIKLSLGVKVDLTNNVYAKGFLAIPQPGLKWTF